jgi:hypothetical protein
MFNEAVINLFLILLIALLFYNMFKNQVIEEPMENLKEVKKKNCDTEKKDIVEEEKEGFKGKKYRTPCHASHNTLTKHHVKLNEFNNLFDNLELQLKETNKKVLKNSNGIRGNEQSIKASANTVNNQAAEAGKAGDKIKY